MRDEVLWHRFERLAARFVGGSAPILASRNGQLASGIVKWGRCIDDTGLDLDSVDLWRPSYRREDLCRIPSIREFISRTTYLYYTDGSRQQNRTVGYALTAVIDGQIVSEGQFCLSDGADVFAAEVHAIKEAMTDAHHKDLSELDIYSDSRSSLQSVNSLVPRHRSISEIRDLLKFSGIGVHMHWMKAHVGHVINKCAKELAKAATTLLTVIWQ